MLKGNKKTILEVNYNDLDQAITEFLKSKGYSCKNFDRYGYECIAYEEWGNGESHSFDVEPTKDEFEIKDILEDKNLRYKTADILNWMCAEKLIEPGEYLVEVYW